MIREGPTTNIGRAFDRGRETRETYVEDAKKRAPKAFSPLSTGRKRARAILLGGLSADRGHWVIIIIIISIIQNITSDGNAMRFPRGRYILLSNYGWYHIAYYVYWQNERFTRDSATYRKKLRRKTGRKNLFTRLKPNTSVTIILLLFAERTRSTNAWAIIFYRLIVNFD